MCRLQEQDVIKIPTRMELQTDLGCPQGYKIISKFQPPWNFKLTWIVHKVIRRYQNSHPSEPRVSQSAFKIPQSYTLCFTIQVSQSVRQVSQSDWQFAESVWEVWRSDREVSQSDADDFGFIGFWCGAQLAVYLGGIQPAQAHWRHGTDTCHFSGVELAEHPVSSECILTSPIISMPDPESQSFIRVFVTAIKAQISTWKGTIPIEGSHSFVALVVGE